MKTIIDFANKVKSLVDGRMSNIANVEESPSTHAYAVGKQLIFNGLLCKATSAIAVGDTLAVGTNLALADNVVEQIYSLNQGLTNSLNEIADMNNVLGAKNLLPNDAITQTINGITFTVNDDGSVKVNGTATANINLYICNKFILKKGTYILSKPYEDAVSFSDTYIWVRDSEGNTIKVTTTADAEFTLANDTVCNCILVVNSGYNASNKISYPMIRPASIKDDTYVPYSMTNREMTPYVQSISNPNLLDNPWFTVNQRGFTSDSNPSAGTHLVDRWAVRYNPSSGAVAVADNIVTLTSNDGFLIIGERFEENVGFSGKTMTASIMLSDGTIYSGTGIFPNENWADVNVIDTSDLIVYYQYSSFSGGYPFLGILCKPNKTLSIKAVKLELGSISTLAMDTAPNYQQELAKCQRYFQRIKSNQNGMQAFYTIATSSSSLRGLLILQENMRNKPTITISDITGLTLYNSGTPKQVNALAIENIDANNRYVKLTMGTSDVAINGVYAAEIANGVYIDFSADL